MPISPENMKLYPGGSINSPEWKAIRARIQERAGDKCEFCGVENRAQVVRHRPQEDRIVIIVCTTAHLNHDVTDNRDENLKFLCQHCHLRYDAKHHQANAEQTRRLKLASGDLFDKQALIADKD